jgi:hypothetical protein
MCKKQVAVVIPVHNEKPTYFEEISIRQCLKVLSNYPLVFLSRTTLDTSRYEELSMGKEDVSFLKMEYRPGVYGFDELMVSSRFYEQFLDYKFILIYHTDSFVFRNELEEWCNKDYDYVGAAIYNTDFINMFWTYSKLRHFLKLTKNRYNGNGGFCLRKVKPHYVNSKIFKPFTTDVGKGFGEDMFWSFKIPILNPFFKVPRFEKVKNFGYDGSPRELFELNNRQLPFGCHRWHMYDLDFWRPHFKEQGFVV